MTAWRPITDAPRDGTPIVARVVRTYRWKAYKPGYIAMAPPKNRPAGGRWQVHDGYGWKNAPDGWEPAEWLAGEGDSDDADA